jgi:hypothetical protein
MSLIIPGAGLGQGKVHNDEVRPGGVNADQGFGSRARLATNLQVGLIIEQLGKAFPGDRVILNEVEAASSGFTR